jgi:hypothetical protein
LDGGTVMATKLLQLSFTGGEIAQDLLGRIDDPKVKAGLATCRNFRIRPQGPIENRAGFAWVWEVKDSTKKTRLISFTYSTTQTMVIELGAGYFRFHSQGGVLGSDATLHTFDPTTTPVAFTPYEISNPYAEADLMDIHFVQSGDILTLVHPNYPVKELKRFAATNWVLSDEAFAPTVLPPTAIQLSGNAKGADYHYSYVVTAFGSDVVSESVIGDAISNTGSTISAITQANPGEITTSAAHGLAVNDKVYITGIVGMTQLNGNKYRVGTVPSTTKITLLDMQGNAINTTGFGAYTSGGSVSALFVVNNIFTTGGKNTITWTASAGATRYNVYKEQGGVSGFIGSTTSTVFVDDNIAPDMGITPPLYDTVFASSSNYPGAVSYFEQRKIFAGTINQAQNIWMTKSGTETTMSYRLPVHDDDRIAVRVAAREANTIRHIVPMNNLVLLTSGAEWEVKSVNSDAITPTSISVKPQTYIGANNVQPLVINSSVVYAAARGGHIRQLAYQLQAGGLDNVDMSIRAPHLFDDADIVDIAYSKAPLPTIWCVSSAGTLLSMTFLPEQEVAALSWHDTQGTFESICVVAEGAEDILYSVVKRTINGSDVRYIERLKPRKWATQSDAFFVDCGATYNGAATDTVSNLIALEGMTVSILADGAVHPTRVVTGGKVRLESQASKVQIGLGYISDAKTLPISAQVDSAFGQGRMKNVNKVYMRTMKSGTFRVGPNEDRMIERKSRTTENYGVAPAFKTDEFEVAVAPEWNTSGQMLIRNQDPTPLTIENITFEVVLGG